MLEELKSGIVGGTPAGIRLDPCITVQVRPSPCGKGGLYWRVDLHFVWDPRKAAKNVRKHGVEFAEAATVLGDPLSLTIPDLEHSAGEFRWIDVGRSTADRLLVVIYTETETPVGTRVRLISARVADPDERRAYEEGQ